MDQQIPGKGMSIAALVLGIIACAGCWYGTVSGIVCIVISIVGLVLAILARKKASEAGVKNGIALAGMILSIVGLVLSIIGLIICGICVAAATAVASSPEGQEAINQLQQQLESIAQ